MTKVFSAVIALLFAFGTSACSSDKSGSQTNESGKSKARATPETRSEKGGHASSDVVPGSHEDWCGEHGVPESQCTRCNPKLGAAFKATGDWCDEHGLPKSQCKRCNPDLAIVRPPPGTKPAKEK